MSVINFKCSDDKKENVKNICWSIIQKHYLSTVHPNTRVKYTNEGIEIYKKRLDELMNDELCSVEYTEDGVSFEFDSTEDAGFLIADCVYKTNMGYSDDGLTFLKPLFDELIIQMPNICFDAECECDDKWISEEYSCSYDGEVFETDAEWVEYE